MTPNEMTIIFLYVLSVLLTLYCIRKNVQIENMRYHAELGRSYEMSMKIREGLMKKTAESKGLTKEQFEKMWGNK